MPIQRRFDKDLLAEHDSTGYLRGMGDVRVHAAGKRGEFLIEGVGFKIILFLYQNCLFASLRVHFGDLIGGILLVPPQHVKVCPL